MKLVSLDKSWFVCRATAKSVERAAAAIRLSRIEGVSVYLPVMKIERKDRRTKVYREEVKPLLVKYMFVGFDPKNKCFDTVREQAKRRGSAVKFVECQGWPVPIPAKDLELIEEAEIDMRFDDTRAARIHRREEAKTRKATTEMTFPSGKSVKVVDPKHWAATFSGVVEEVTKTGNVKALVYLFGRATSVEFEAGQLKPAA